MGEVNAFDVLKKLGEEDNKSLKSFPLSNLRSTKGLKDGLGLVEITVDQQTVLEIINGDNILGMFIVVSKRDFKKAEKELEQAGDSK